MLNKDNIKNFMFCSTEFITGLLFAFASIPIVIFGYLLISSFPYFPFEPYIQKLIAKYFVIGTPIILFCIGYWKTCRTYGKK